MNQMAGFMEGAGLVSAHRLPRHQTPQVSLTQRFVLFFQKYFCDA